MNITSRRFTEILPADFDIQHKITAAPEKNTFHAHKQLEMVFTLSDNLKYCFEIDGEVITIPRYNLLLLNTFDLHYLLAEKDSGLLDRFVLYFSPDFLANIFASQINLFGCFLHGQKEHALLIPVPEDYIPHCFSLLNRLESCYKSQQFYSDFSAPEKQFYLQLLLSQFLLYVNRFCQSHYGSKQDSPSYLQHSQLVSGIRSYIEKNYQKPLTTELLSREFLISKTQLYNTFLEVCGCTVTDYLINYRIARAKDLLINTLHSVEFISDEVGYNSLSSFSRVFKERVGISPLQYRKRYTDDSGFSG